jgi:hypothetical protein
LSTAIITEQKNNRCTCDITFDRNFDEVLDFFKTIDKRFWDKEKKLWSFPAESLTKLVSGLESLGIDVTVREYKPLVELIEQENNFLARTVENTAANDICSELDGSVWDSRFGLWRVPIKELKKCYTSFMENRIGFILTYDPTFAVVKKKDEEQPKKKVVKKLFDEWH